MKNVVIVGGGGFGRELACWLEQTLEHDAMRIAGFLDDGFAVGAPVHVAYRYPVLGAIADYVIGEHDLFVLAIGAPAAKLRIAAELEARGAVFMSVIHPSALLARTAVLGKGVVMCPFSLVSADAEIGNFVALNAYTSIGHDAVVGAGCTLSAHVDITGSVVLGQGVFAGTHAAVLPKVKVGAGATIGAGAIVARNVAAGTTVYAMPAKKL